MVEAKIKRKRNRKRGKRYRDQHSETNVMHFLFSLLRIKGLYMFRALLAHPLEVLHKWHLVHCMRAMSVSCTRFGVHSNPDAAN
jgi:hypothetical protein